MRKEEAPEVAWGEEVRGRTQKSGKCPLFLIRVGMFEEVHTLRAGDLRRKGVRGKKY